MEIKVDCSDKVFQYRLVDGVCSGIQSLGGQKNKEALIWILILQNVISDGTGKFVSKDEIDQEKEFWRNFFGDRVENYWRTSSKLRKYDLEAFFKIFRGRYSKDLDSNTDKIINIRNLRLISFHFFCKMLIDNFFGSDQKEKIEYVKTIWIMNFVDSIWEYWQSKMSFLSNRSHFNMRINRFGIKWSIRESLIKYVFENYLQDNK